MDEQTQNDIRRLLKTFGVKADAAIQAHLQEHPEIHTLRVRVVLEDLSTAGSEPLHLVVDGEIHRGDVARV